MMKVYVQCDTLLLAAMLQDPDTFSQARRMSRADSRLPAQTPALFIDCKDPVRLMVSFSGGPLLSTPSPAPAVRYGVLVMNPLNSDSYSAS